MRARVLKDSFWFRVYASADLGGERLEIGARIHFCGTEVRFQSARLLSLEIWR